MKARGLRGGSTLRGPSTKIFSDLSYVFSFLGWLCVVLPVKVLPSRLRIAESSLGGWGYGFGPISRPWVCWSKVGTPTWRQPPKHPRPPREVHVCALPPEGPGTVRWIAGRYCPPPFHTLCLAKDRGGERCSPHTSLHRALLPSPRPGAAGAEGGMREEQEKEKEPPEGEGEGAGGRSSGVPTPWIADHKGG